MAKMSIILPSRDERFLLPTIHDIFRNAQGETEVIAVIDSNLWPEGWKEITAQYPNLHTIFHGESLGMRAAINSGAASAISRGAKYLAKFDAHCSFSEGFDEVLKSNCEPDWIVVPRRGRLDPEAWRETELSKPPIDYHYLSFPDDPNDFGGPGLNGKVWAERAVERASYDLDEEMSSQGSGWMMHADYFTQLELMDQVNYGPFWNEMQEIANKAWLSGGRVMVNKKAKYLHLHKGKKHGRGYKLPESWLQQGRAYAARWAYNEAWPKQTLPFEWLIDHFWPVPSWPKNWREVLYATRKPRVIGVGIPAMDNAGNDLGNIANDLPDADMSLKIHKAHYGIGSLEDIDVRERLQSLVKNSSLDIIVNNSTLTPNQNPFRGKKKQLNVIYSFDGSGKQVTRRVEEKDWLIIGPPRQRDDATGDLPAEKVEAGLRQGILEPELVITDEGLKEVAVYVVGSELIDPIGSRAAAEFIAKRDGREDDVRDTQESFQRAMSLVGVKPLTSPPTTAATLNDFLIRKFNISPQRLRGPMPIELRDFHRNDLAQLFAELGFKRGAEIGVAEGKYSEVLLKANPECGLLLVDPWHHYSANPQGKSKEKHEFAYNEAKRKMADYHNVEFLAVTSMTAVPTVDDDSLDFCYIDGNHLFDYVIQDLVEWSKRVRSGGIVSGDDYYALDQKRWVGGGVVEAVQAYTNAHRIAVWYLFTGHKSVDYMWVRP